MGATLFDLGTPVGAPARAPAPAPVRSAAPRGGRRKAPATTHSPESQPHGTALHPDAPTLPIEAAAPIAPMPAAAPVVAPAAPSGLPKPLPPFDPDDTSFYAMSYKLLRASPAELAAVEARHRAEGYGLPPSPDALAGAISACAPRERPAGPWVTCECGAEMLEDQHAEHLARATRPATWSLHSEFMRERAERAQRVGP